MRKGRLFVLGALVLLAWMAVTYFLYFHRPKYGDQGGAGGEAGEVGEAARSAGFYFGGGGDRGSAALAARRRDLEGGLSELQRLLKEQVRQNRELEQQLEALRAERRRRRESQGNGAAAAGSAVGQAREEFKDFDEETGQRAEEEKAPKEKIAVLMIACNRPAVAKALDSLLEHRKDPQRYPIIVSQDCGHAETRRTIQGYGENVTLIEHPDHSEPEVPPKEKKFKGYFKIARHYKWALDQVFRSMGHEQVIVVEDDLEFSPDFFEYFSATLPVLKSDPSLFCVSAWNDNGKEALIDPSRPDLLHRTDFFGGLGWMLTRSLWEGELSEKWPRSYWDDWMRDPAQRRGRACVRPEISRTKTFGKIGVSNGLFYDKHLKYIKLSDEAVDFTKKDLKHLTKDVYDPEMTERLSKIPVVSLEEVRSGSAGAKHPEVRLLYHTKLAFKKYAKVLGIMDDFKSGVPRMAYRGVVSTMYKGLRVHVAPNLNWKGYDPKW